MGFSRTICQLDFRVNYIFQEGIWGVVDYFSVTFGLLYFYTFGLLDH